MSFSIHLFIGSGDCNDLSEAHYVRCGGLDHGEPGDGQRRPAVLETQRRGRRPGSVERGQYLVQIGGCNDCHTAGYAEKAGNVPESEWLIGAPVGFKGAWGTSYAANLRLTLERTHRRSVGNVRARAAPPADAVVQPARHER